MGRGRSKAKHTKVARDLKYSSQEMDLERLTKNCMERLAKRMVLMNKLHTPMQIKFSKVNKLCGPLPMLPH